MTVTYDSNSRLESYMPLMMKPVWLKSEPQNMSRTNNSEDELWICPENSVLHERHEKRLNRQNTFNTLKEHLKISWEEKLGIPDQCFSYCNKFICFTTCV